jgi:hypothetical protein
LVRSKGWLAVGAVLSAGCDAKGAVQRDPVVIPTQPSATVAMRSSDAGLSPTVDASAPAPASSEQQSKTLACRCDVIGFESDGPPKGACTLVLAPDGSGMLTGTTSTPKLTAQLEPVRRTGERRRVDYVFDGEFDFACKKPWCGKHRLSVLEVAEHDYRVTVARSADGPPSDVLWVTCDQPH